MIVPIELAGRSRPWRLLEGHRLSDWLGGEPWAVCEPPLVAQVPDAQLDAIIDEARGLVRKTLGTTDYVRVEALGPDLCQPGPRQGLWGWMNVPGGSARALAERLASLSGQTPWLFIACLPGEVPAAPWRDELQRVLQIQSKLPTPGQVAFLILDAGREPAAGACRLDLAWPAAWASPFDRETRWAAYLHERIAWHAGGNLQVALDAGTTVPRLAVGDDRSLERALDSHAAKAVEHSPGAMRAAKTGVLAPIIHEPWLQLASGLAGPDSRSTRPAPWVARGILHHRPDHPDRRYLQSLCVCRPVANRLLGRCQDLEQHIRDRLLSKPPGVGPGEQAEQAARRLRNCPDAIEHRLTPIGQVAEQDAWEVATLFDLIRASDPQEPTASCMHSLRRVRNALAHGSPVGWAAFEIIERLESRLRMHACHPSS